MASDWNGDLRYITLKKVDEMGYYLNLEDVLELYRGEAGEPYFVDKTEMLGSSD